MTASGAERDCEWWAMIGPIARGTAGGVVTTPHDRTASLADDYKLGPVWLRPGNRLLREYLRGEPRNAAAIATIESYPILVEGHWVDTLKASNSSASPGSRNNARERAAARVLHRVVTLLSLAWNEPWQVRTSAKSTDQTPARVPHSWPQPPLIEHLDPVNDHDVLPIQRRELPPWTNDAWWTLEEDDRLQSALTFWHQGLHLTAEFPSFALVAFASAVEALSASRVIAPRLPPSAERCGTCGTVPGATARFWSTVALIASPQELDDLKRHWDVYGARSRVAHGGATHGLEAEFGPVILFRYVAQTEDQAPRPTIDETDAAQQFLLERLPAFAFLVRRLLRYAFDAHVDGINQL
jgi:hypothetical protein